MSSPANQSRRQHHRALHHGHLHVNARGHQRFDGTGLDLADAVGTYLHNWQLAKTANNKPATGMSRASTL